MHAGPARSRINSESAAKSAAISGVRARPVLLALPELTNSMAPSSPFQSRSCEEESDDSCSFPSMKATWPPFKPERPKHGRQRRADRHLHPFEIPRQSAGREKRLCPNPGSVTRVDHHNRPGRRSLPRTPRIVRRRTGRVATLARAGSNLPIKRKVMGKNQDRFGIERAKGREFSVGIVAFVLVSTSVLGFDPVRPSPFRKPYQADSANDGPEDRPGTATQRKQQALCAVSWTSRPIDHVSALIRAHIPGIDSSGDIDKLCQRFQDQRSEQGGGSIQAILRIRSRLPQSPGSGTKSSEAHWTRKPPVPHGKTRRSAAPTL